MKIKICGFNDAQSIAAVGHEDIDFIGMEFRDNIARHISNMPTPAGTTIDKPFFRLEESDGRKGGGKSVRKEKGKGYVGVFADQSPQHIISCAYNYNFDYIQLNGGEKPVYIANFLATTVPDILPGVKIIKTLYVGADNSLPEWREYSGLADIVMFEFTSPCPAGSDRLHVFESYDGDMPFLVSGINSPQEIMRLKGLHHERFLGINIYYATHERFTSADIARIRFVTEKIRA